MHISAILTQRSYQPSPSMHLVYEWEDELSRVLGLSFVDDYRTHFSYQVLRKLCPRAATLFKTDRPCLVFEMFAKRDLGNNKKNVVPCIIDFFLRSPEELRRFAKDYRRNPVVLISSKEAHEFLRERGCPLNIRHWALSIADKWVDGMEALPEKKYDLALMGRTNDVLASFLKQYRKSHPSLRCITRTFENGRSLYVDSKTGEKMDGMGREQYVEIMRATRIGLYSTPGMDGANPDANGFNQVTPRFLEYLACGCHVLARYPDNPDTAYYNLKAFAPHVDSYGQFASEIDRCLSEPVDYARCKEHLNRHRTSVRAKELLRILEELR